MTITAINQQVDYPILPTDVWVGWLSQFREWVEPSTDAAIEGIFAVGSIVVACSLGRSISVHYGRPLFSNIYCALIGATSVPRKTTILSRGNDVIRRSFTEEIIKISRSMGSGEGLLELFCKEENDSDSGKLVLAPIKGQRVLLDEPELCNLLKKARRPGTANITEILLALFDGDNLSPRTRSKPISVEEPFFSLVTATTPENLEMSLSEVDVESGLMPRFAIFYCNPREPMAYPPPPDETILRGLISELQTISKHAVEFGKRSLTLSSQAKREWELIFKDMTIAAREQRGLASSMMARIPSMTMKWALMYAILAGHTEILTDDLARACLVGTYLMDTAMLLPNLVQKNALSRVESKIIETLRRLDGKYLTTNEIHRLVSGRIKADDLRRSLESLEKLSVIEPKFTERNVKCYRLNG
jgi:hypothetical protein